jgi:hypothetical protein
MNKNQQATLCAVFDRPTRTNLRWSAIESLFRALGGEIREREGSRVAIRQRQFSIGRIHAPKPKKALWMPCANF